MLFVIGFLVVIGSVIGGYVLHHGKLIVLYQPTEYLIICGAAFGGFLIANPFKYVKDTGKALGKLFKGSPFKKADYIELLTMLFAVMKLMRSKGMLAIEQHIENPHESSLFSQFPKFSHNHHAVEFLCGNLRLMTMGIDDPNEMEDRMNEELEAHHHEHHIISSAVTNIADAMPAIGIVAAVLGVIVTMGSIDQPPAILGGLIGAALVGTFLGVLLSYGYLSPMGRYLGTYFAEEAIYFKCIKTVLLSHLKGNAPPISVEFARKIIGSHEQPTFKELEEACAAAPTGEGG